MTGSALLIPTSIAEAIELRGEYGADLTVMGGGTLVMQAVNEGRLFGRPVMSLQRSGLDGVERSNGHVRIGATTTIETVSRVIELGALAEAARLLGGPALRGMATIGGNLFARPPCDLAVPLLALDAVVELSGGGGSRQVPIETFLGEGALERELVTGLMVRRPMGRKRYVKQGRRAANAPAIVAVSVHLELGDGAVCNLARIALGSVAPHPIRAHRAEEFLLGAVVDEGRAAEAAQIATGECDPATDSMATDWYRRKMVGVFVRRALIAAVTGGREDDDEKPGEVS